MLKSIINTMEVLFFMIKLKSFVVTVLILCAVMTLMPFTALAEEGITNEDIVKEIAYAYDRQGDQILYDQLNARRHVNASPEDATSQKTVYLDCSSFVNSIYREGFGINVLPYELSEMSCSTANYNNYAKNNEGKSVDVIGYWENSEWTTDDAKAQITSFIKDNLKVGDILNYRHLKSSGSYAGHVYVYLGDNTFMHCAGAGSYTVNSTDPSKSYEMDEGETNRIQTITFAGIFTSTTSARYIFKATDADTVTSFSLHRPLAREGIAPTAKALARMEIAGLNMEKTSSISPNTSVKVGDIITYTVTMNNTGDTALSGVTLTDTLDNDLTFLSASEGVSEADGVITWTGDVAAGATVSVTYSVKAADNTDSLIVSDNTYVSGISLGKITHSISSFTDNQTAFLKDTLKSYVNEGKAFPSTISMAFSLYKSVLGIDLSEYLPEKESTDVEGIGVDKNGKLTGLADGVEYEYANLNDTALLTELSEKGALTSDFTYSPVTDETVLTAGVWGVREVSSTDVSVVYVKGDSTDNIFHLDENGRPLNDGRPYDGMSWTKVIDKRGTRIFNKGIWSGPLGYHSSTSSSIYGFASQGNDCLINYAGKSYAGLHTGYAASFNAKDDYETLVYAVESEYETYQYLDSEVIPFSDFVSYSYQTYRNRTYISADGAVNTKFIFYVITEDGKLVTREWTDPMNFNSATKKNHTVKVEDFEDKTGYIVAMEIHPTGDVPDTTTLSAASNVANDNGTIYAIIIKPDGYKTVGSDMTILDETIDTTALTKRTDTDFSKLIAPTLYGGMSIRTGMYKIPDGERSRLVRESDLAVGDIIIADWSGGKSVYVYGGDSTLVTVSGTKTTAKTIGDDIYGSGADNILISLLAYDRYVVIRPSMLASESEVTVSSIEVTTPPTKTEYFDHEEFDPAGMVVTVTLSNGTSFETTAFTTSHSAFTSPKSSVTVSYGGVSTGLEVDVLSVEAIEVTTLPTKTEYYNKEAFDPTGMVVSAIFSNGSKEEITDYTVTPEIFTYPDNIVTVTFGSFTDTFEIALNEEYITVGVDEVKLIEEGNTVNVEGYYVGAGYEGYPEILIKDIDSDTIIGVKGVPFNTAFPNCDYIYGDKIKFIATVSSSVSSYSPGRKYLTYSNENTDVESTIISRGNKITYSFDNVVTVTTQTELKNALNADDFYGYIKFVGNTYFSGYQGSGATSAERFRIHKNASAAGVDNIRIDGKQVASLHIASNAVGLGNNWYTNLFSIDYKNNKWPGPVSNKTFYAVYVGAGQYYNGLVILDESWILDPLKVKGVSLLLDGKIGVKVYYEYDSSVIDVDTLAFSAAIKNSNDSSEREITLPVNLESDGKTAYSIIYVNPKDVDNITVVPTITATRLSDSTTITLSDIPELSVKTYIEEYKKAAETNEVYKPYFKLTSALETYCHCADVYFDANKTETEAIILTDKEKGSLERAMSFATVTNKTGGALVFHSSSLILEESVTLRHYFKVSSGIKLEDLTVEGGSPLQYPKNSTEYAYVDVENIPAHKLSEFKTVTVNYGDKSCQVKFSAINYSAITMNNNNVELSNLTKALYRYSYEADYLYNGGVGVVSAEIAKMPDKTVYNHRDTVDTLDLTGGQLLVMYSDFSVETVDMTKEMISLDESDEWKIGTVNYVLTYKGEKLSLPIEYKNEALKISDFLKGTVGETYDLTGVVVGAVTTHKYHELLIKDKNSAEFISVINTGNVGTANTNLGLNTEIINVGDEVVMSVDLFRTATNSTADIGNRGRYAANAVNSATFIQGLRILSTGNEITYDLSNATEISTQAELKAFVGNSENFYTFAKLSGVKAIHHTNSSGKTGYRIFFDGVTSASSQLVNSVSPYITHDTANLYLTNGVKTYFNKSYSTSYSSPATAKYDMYVFFIGGNNYYYDMSPLDDSFIIVE